MNPFSGDDSLGIRYRIGLLALLIGTSFLGIAYLVWLGFSNVERLTQQVTQADLRDVVETSSSSRELSEIFSDIDLLSLTFIDRGDQVRFEAERIKTALGGLQRRSGDAALRRTLESLQLHFAGFVEHCVRINTLRDAQREADGKARALLTNLEAPISREMIRKTLENGDTEYEDQLMTLVTGYRESVLEIGRLYSELRVFGEPRETGNRFRELNDRLDDLALRLLTISASRPDIATIGEDLARQLDQYSSIVDKLETELAAIRDRLTYLDLAKLVTHTAMDAIDATSERRAVTANSSIDQVVHDAQVAVLVMTVTLFILVSVYMVTILRRNFDRPMQRVLHMIRSIGDGKSVPDADALPDEWNTISTALRQMSDEIDASYHALQESERRYRMLVENQTDLIVKYDHRGTITFVSPSCIDFFGRPEADLIGMPFNELLHPDDQEETAHAATELLASAQTINLDTRSDTPQGLRWVSWMHRSYPGHAQDDDEVMAVGRDVTSERAARAEVDFLAHHDALTRLPNRVLLNDRFQQATRSAARDDTMVALLFLDLDRFKHINDSLGHDAGDQVLLSVVERLKSTLRSTDTISRQGGDEFIVVAPAFKQISGIERVVRNIQAALAPPIDVNGRELHTSFSIGISLYPQDGEDFETLMKNADTAMYSAKQAGRHTYRFFNEQMNRQAEAHLHLQTELRKGLDQDDLALFYQPQIDLGTGQLVALEALSRWDTAALGSIPPSRFIPLAEESGIIRELGDWVIRKACTEAAGWESPGTNRLGVSVNLSALQFREGDIVETVKTALTNSGLPPALLELELTESVLLDDHGGIPETIKALKALGVTLAIDDFGTGYSSLSYLRRFAVDRLKIDKQFVQGVTNDADSAVIVRAIIQMARSLRLEVIAEGVETREQFQWLVHEGCQRVQGFFTGYPLPAEKVAHMLKAHRPLVPGPLGEISRNRS